MAGGGECPPLAPGSLRTWLEMGQTSMGMSFFQASAQTAGCLLKANPWPILVEFSIRASRTFLSAEVPCQSRSKGGGSSVGWMGPTDHLQVKGPDSPGRKRKRNEQ